LEHFILNPQVRLQLPDVISRQVGLIFQAMFGVSVEKADRIKSSFNDDDLVACASLSQGDLKILLRFSFPRLLLAPLLQKIYGPVLGKHETTFEDAVCEIANIVCNGVKKHLNENGFSFLMNIPKIDHDYNSRYAKGSDDHIELEFLLKDEHFCVDMITFFKKDVFSNEAYS
jgi:CheY-specific phosphatase CheX